KVDPRAQVAAVVVIGAAADQVAVHYTRFVHRNAAADVEVELALGHGGHAPPLDAAGAGRDLDAVTHAGDRFVGGEERAGDAQQVLVLAEVLGGPASAKENTQVLLRADVAEGDVGLNGVALPLLGNGPARLDLVQHHLVATRVRGRDDRLEAVFLQA